MSSKVSAPGNKMITFFMYFWCFWMVFLLVICLSGGIDIIHILLGLGILCMMYLGVRFLSFFVKKGDLLYNLSLNPSEQSAKEYLEYYKQRRPKLYSSVNHPRYWNLQRDCWYKINGSNKIPTDLKVEILATLKRDGLGVKDTIVDNYNK